MPSLKLDSHLSLATLLVIIIGIIGHISLSPGHLFSHVLFIIFGLVIAFLLSQFDSHLYPYFWVYFYLFAIASLVLTLLLGAQTRGASRWISLGPLQIQPSEIAKPLLILSFAQFLSTHPPHRFSALLLSLAFILLPVFLILIQPDLGSALIVSVIAFAMVFAASVRFRYLFLFLGLALVSAPFAWHQLRPYQQSRILTFLNPQADPLGEGYNTIQSLIAVGSGGVLGKGLGRGSQSQLQFLPEYQTDFVFAALAEEFGLIGSVLLLLVYFWLLWRLSQIAAFTHTRFAYLVVIGTLTFIAAQVVINIGMNIGLLPITGITLPLVSAGGSSTLAILMSLGIVASIAKHTKLPQAVEIS